MSEAIDVEDEDGNNKLVCDELFGSPEIKNAIRNKGTLGACGLHTHFCIRLLDLLPEIDEMFRRKYNLVEDYSWIDLKSESRTGASYEGESLEESLSSLLLCDDCVSKAVAHALCEQHSIDDYNEGAIFFDKDAEYELCEDQQQRCEADEWDYYSSLEEWFDAPTRYSWFDFCKKVKDESRFYYVKEWLDKLFSASDDFFESSGAILSLEQGTKIFRARRIENDDEKKRISESPQQELWMPPSKDVKNGRMNVAGIPVFYGVLEDHLVAISEVQPYIQQEVAVATFVFERELRFFDFSALNQKSIHQQEHASNNKHQVYDVLQEIKTDISKPIKPSDKEYEYIPTQILAEYIKERFKVDGIVFMSSLYEDGKNVVLFLQENNRNQKVLSYNSKDFYSIERMRYESKKLN